jgi:hypothetical protein
MKPAPALVLISALVATLGLAACSKRSGSQPEKSEGSAATPASAATAAPAPAPALPPVPERFTLAQVTKGMDLMKQCAERSLDPHALSACACRADLQLSKTFKAPDPAAHCTAFADRFAAIAKRPVEEQMQAPFELAAPDVFPGSFLLFTLSTPCLLKASQEKSLAAANACFCRAHVFANRMAARGLPPGATGRDVLQATSELAEELMKSDPCPSSGG